jgi:hypothetical protein
MTSKSSASITEASLSKLLFKMPRLPLDRNKRAVRRFANVSISSSVRFLRAARLKRYSDYIGYLTFIAKILHNIYRLRMAKSRANYVKKVKKGVQSSPDRIFFWVFVNWKDRPLGDNLIKTTKIRPTGYPNKSDKKRRSGR